MENCFKQKKYITFIVAVYGYIHKTEKYYKDHKETIKNKQTNKKIKIKIERMWNYTLPSIAGSNKYKLIFLWSTGISLYGIYIYIYIYIYQGYKLVI